MRLLQVTRQYAPEVIGGYERNCQRFAEEWARRGHDIAILTRQAPSSPRRETLQGVEVFRDLPDIPPNRRAKGVRSRLYQLQVGWTNRLCHRATRRVLQAWQPEAVVFWGMNSSLVSPILAVHQQGIPCLADLGDYWLAESLGMYVPASTWRTWYRKNVMLGGEFSSSMFREVWVHSRYMQEVYCEAGMEPEKVRVIPRGLDVSFTATDPGPRQNSSKPLRILCVGRLVPDKGARVLAEAFSKLRQHVPDVELHFYGDAWNWYRKDLERDCRAYGLLDESLFIHDRVEPQQMLALYLQHDILAFPVLWNEPSSNVLLEAMATRLPIIATSTGSNAEFVREGQTGLLVEPGSPEALAQGLRVLIESPGLRQRMGEKARETVLAQHLQEKIFDQTEAQLLACKTVVTR